MYLLIGFTFVTLHVYMYIVAKSLYTNHENAYISYM